MASELPLAEQSDVLTQDWSQIAAALGIDDDDAEACKSVINRLKSDFCVLMSRRTTADGLPPIKFFAKLLHQHLDPDQPWESQPIALSQAYWSFLQYAHEQIDSYTERPYTELVRLAEDQAQQTIEDLLDTRQMARFRTHYARQMMSLKTGKDPFGDALQSIYLELSSAEGGENARAEAAEAATRIEQPLGQVLLFSGDHSITLADLSKALDLNPEQTAQVKERLNTLKDEVAALFDVQSEDASSPASRLEELLRKSGGAMSPSVSSEFIAYLGHGCPVGSQQPFRAHFAELEIIAAREISQWLEPEQHSSFVHLPREILPKVETGYDPVGALISGRLSGANAEPLGRITWQDLRQRLRLEDTETAEWFEQTLNRLKDEFVLLISARPASGEQSPLEAVAGLPEDEAGLALQRETRTRIHPLFGVPYTVAFGKLEAERREGMIARLAPEQRAAWSGLALKTLLDIDTGYDPLYAALQSQRSQSAVPEAAPTVPPPADAKGLAQWLQLDASLSKELVARIDELKESLLSVQQLPSSRGAAPFQVLVEGIRNGNAGAAGQRFMEALTRTREAKSGKTYAALGLELAMKAQHDLASRLPPQAQDRWRRVRADELLAVETGHDPLAAAIRQALKGQGTAKIP